MGEIALMEIKFVPNLIFCVKVVKQTLSVEIISNKHKISNHILNA